MRNQETQDRCERQPTGLGILRIAAKILKASGDIEVLDEDWIRRNVVSRAQTTRQCQRIPPPQQPTSNG